MEYFMQLFFFFFNDTATTEIYTLSLHDALPISYSVGCGYVAPAHCLPECRQSPSRPLCRKAQGVGCSLRAWLKALSLDPSVVHRKRVARRSGNRRRNPYFGGRRALLQFHESC